MKISIGLVLIFAIILSACAPYQPITTFEECIAAGNPVMESYPRQCKADGQTFVETIDIPVVGEVESEQVIKEEINQTVPEEESVFLIKEDDSDSEKLPKCDGLFYTVSPVDLDEVYEITPLGNIGPPGHTVPTNHMYLHISPGQSSNKIIPLRAPGDIFITEVSIDDDDASPGRDEYRITFALCEDVYGYFNHVKSISDELKTVLAEVECEQWTHNPGNICAKRFFYKVDAGTVIAGVGHKQGNFDFGSYDTRITHDFVNPDRHDYQTLSIVCPLGIYDESDQSQFYDKIERIIEPRCGEIMQDIKGTLQGNWYTGGGTFSDPAGWEGQLAFVMDNDDPSKLIVSVGGVISDPAKWVFTPKTSGLFQRKFSDVISDGNIYCYEAEDTGRMSDRIPDGRIIVEMTGDTELKIEQQSGSCSGSISFNQPTVYSR